MHCSVAGKHKSLTGLEGFCFKSKIPDTCPKLGFKELAGGMKQGRAGAHCSPAGRVKGMHKETSQEVYVCCLFSEATEYFQITGKYNGIFISLST